MNTVKTETIPDIISISDDAINRIYELILEEGNPNISLRVFVQGGGCSGFQYGFTFDDAINEDDTIINKKPPFESTNPSFNTVRLIVDAMSLMYLSGSVIDFKIGAEGEEFTIVNPHASTTCGCGMSFSI